MYHRSQKKWIVSFFFLLGFHFYIQECFAGDFRIIDIHRNIPLKDADEVFKDYYITGGLREGFKENQVVNIVRQRILKPSEGSKETFNLQIRVGKLKIISVQNGISIARLYETSNPESTPSVEQPGMIVGDIVDLAGSFVDTKKKIRVKDTERMDGHEEEKLDIDGIPFKDKKIQKDKNVSSINSVEQNTLNNAKNSIEQNTLNTTVNSTGLNPSNDKTIRADSPDLSRKEASVIEAPVNGLSPKEAERKGTTSLTKSNEQISDKKETSEKTPGPDVHTEQ